MVGEHLGEVLNTLPGLGFQPLPGCQMLCSTPGAGDLLVGDVSDEQVPEPVLRLPLHRRLAGRPHQLFARELVQRPLDLMWITVVHCADGAGPEHLPQHRRVLEEGLALLGKGVKAGRDQCLDRLGERHVRCLSESAALVEEIAVAQHPHELLGIQRVSAGPLEQELLRLRREHRPFQQGGDELGGVGVGKRREVDRCVIAQPCAPGGMRLVQLGPGGTHDE